MGNIKIISYLPSIDVVIYKKIKHVHELFGQPSYTFKLSLFACQFWLLKFAKISTVSFEYKKLAIKEIYKFVLKYWNNN
jgi:hypothetical protein